MKGISDHGMACCGLINSNGPFYGVAPGCKVLPVNCESGVDPDGECCIMIPNKKLLKLLNKLAPHVDVMSFSWKKTDFDDTVIDKINELATTGGKNSKGVLMVWAAGNDSSRLKSQIADDIAHLPNVAVVGAICSRAYRSHYSNYGRGLRLCAPSDNKAYSPDQDPLQQALSLFFHSVGPKGTQYFGGTSAATPLV